MSKLRYKEGGIWKSIAPSQKEFDDNKNEVTAQLADIVTEYIKQSYGAKGDGITDDTAAFQNAAMSGINVIITSGTYIVKGSLNMANDTKFTMVGKVIFKIMSDVTIFKMGVNNHITGGLTIDLTGIVPYTQDVFEISSATLQGKTAEGWPKLAIKIYDIDLVPGNSGLTAEGSLFNVWACKETEEGIAYTTGYSFWDIDIKNVNVKQGYIGYVFKNWCYRKNNLVSDGWITGVRLSNFMVYGAQYSIFGSKNESTMSNPLYYDASTFFIDTFITEYTTKSKLVAFFTDFGKTLTKCFVWDFPTNIKPYVSLYRPAITNAKIYFDGDSRELKDIYDIRDFPATMSTREKTSYIKSFLSHYTVKNNSIVADYSIKKFGLGGATVFPYYIKLAEFTDVNQKDSAFLLNMGYNMSDDRGTVLVTLKKADSSPTNPATNPILQVHTNPYISPSRLGEFYISKSVTNGVPLYKIYLKLTSNSIGAGGYYLPFFSDSVYSFPIEFESVADPTSTETLLLAADFSIVNLPVKASNPGIPFAGFMYFNDIDKKPYVHDGTSFKLIPKIVAIPASSTSAGNVGDIAYDSNYLYICTTVNSWKRVAIAIW